MNNIAAVVGWTNRLGGSNVLDSFKACEWVGPTAIIAPPETPAPDGKHATIRASNRWSRDAVVEALRWCEGVGATHVLWCLNESPDLPAESVRRMAQCAVDTSAVILYGDFWDAAPDGRLQAHPLVDYQSGSIRDDFDFGDVLLLRVGDFAGLAKEMERDAASDAFGGWYDFRLRLSEHGPVVRLPEPLYARRSTDGAGGDSGEAHFQYVDPRNRDYQLEMEQVATAHLKRIGAYLDSTKQPLVESDATFPVEASVVIPVRNRERTIADAVTSALAQETEVPFNVIVVDNHSTDATTQIVNAIAEKDARLIHKTPIRSDLGIGGCWNAAIHADECGRYAAQLDSDDLYDGTDVLARIVAEFRRAPYAMVIGAYTIVDFDLNTIPPGLIDHREWTDENGHNNALRIGGLGAPRAFHVPTLRTIGFPNVSFGEDYAIGLRLARGFRIGRIYDSLYWCRRWEDNTDHALPLEALNRHAVYKDRIRSIEIAARQARS